MILVRIETGSFAHPCFEPFADRSRSLVSLKGCSQRVVAQHILEIAAVVVVRRLCRSQRELRMGEHVLDAPAGPAKADNPDPFAIRQAWGGKLLYRALEPRDIDWGLPRSIVGGFVLPVLAADLEDSYVSIGERLGGERGREPAIEREIMG